jgi:hypothetical protein
MTQSGDVWEPPGVRGNSSKRQDSFWGRQETTRGQELQQVAGLIKGTSGTHQESWGQKSFRGRQGTARNQGLRQETGQDSFLKCQGTTRSQGQQQETGSFRRRKGTTRSQGQQQETGIIQETSGNHKESGAAARDRNHSGDVREPPGVRGNSKRQDHSGDVKNHQESGATIRDRIVQETSGNQQESEAIE